MSGECRKFPLVANELELFSETMASSRGGKKLWCVPTLDDEFIERMEDVLKLYEKPLDPEEPVVCLDEKPVQCLDDARTTVRVKKSATVRRDYEYVRRGTANVFCAVEPKTGRYFAKSTRRRKNPDFARMIRDIARAYPHARTIHLVMDNLSTHTLAALEQTFGQVEARTLWSRFSVHYTPKHASCLNQAEIAVGMLTRQCLGRRRIGSLDQLRVETRAWRNRTNRAKCKIDWGFTVKDARRKFRYKRAGGRINLSRH